MSALRIHAPGQGRFARRVCVVRSWNPEGAMGPAAVDRVDISRLDAMKILMLPQESMLVIDFPKRTW